MENDKGAYFLLLLNGEPTEHDNAEAARKLAHIHEQTDPDGTRRLYKYLPGLPLVEIMI